MFAHMCDLWGVDDGAMGDALQPYFVTTGEISTHFSTAKSGMPLIRWGFGGMCACGKGGCGSGQRLIVLLRSTSESRTPAPNNTTHTHTHTHSHSRTIIPANVLAGSFFCVSADRRYLVKTMDVAEVKRMRALLPAYVEHVAAHPDTLLARVFGVFSVSVNRTNKVCGLVGALHLVMSGWVSSWVSSWVGV